MTHVDQMHLRENLGQEENRINVGLFGMLAQIWFREWLLGELSLRTDAVIYPPSTEKGFRPDLKVADPENDSSVAWIEVELGSDARQADEYKEKLDEPVKTIWGREADGADLSLERIAEFLERAQSNDNLCSQVRIYVTHLHGLISQGLNNFRPASKRAIISEEVKTHWFLSRLIAQLGDRLRFDLGKIRPGELKVDTVGPAGFSLRVFSTVSANGEVSIAHRRAGRPRLRLSSRRHLEEKLPEHKTEIEAYAIMLRGIGCDIDTVAGDCVIEREEDKNSLKRNFREFTTHLEALAESPSSR